jgi:hypothetical protein
MLDPRVETEIDAEGGLRLRTNGTPIQATWDTDVQFTDAGTLKETGTGTAAVLELRPAQMPLTRHAATGTGAVLGPLPTTVLDNDDVEDPTVVKVGDKYVMWYTGRAEDGSPPAIFRLETEDPNNWAHPAGGQPVLEATPGAFDAHGVYGADVGPSARLPHARARSTSSLSAGNSGRVSTRAAHPRLA